ncbi:hypothetical protein COOONC_24491 [Cooperia oncophora]
MIHMSSDANRLLEEVGGYRTEKRGEVIIKGKGVMETYWLLGVAERSISPARPETGSAGEDSGTASVHEE